MASVGVRQFVDSRSSSLHKWSVHSVVDVASVSKQSVVLFVHPYISSVAIHSNRPSSITVCSSEVVRRPRQHGRESKEGRAVYHVMLRTVTILDSRKAQQFRVLLRTLATIGFDAAMQFHVLLRTLTTIGLAKLAVSRPAEGGGDNPFQSRQSRFTSY